MNNYKLAFKTNSPIQTVYDPSRSCIVIKGDDLDQILNDIQRHVDGIDDIDISNVYQYRVGDEIFDEQYEAILHICDLELCVFDFTISKGIHCLPLHCDDNTSQSFVRVYNLPELVDVIWLFPIVTQMTGMTHEETQFINKLSSAIISLRKKD